ncbi:FecR family protein [Mucilaginibacter terrae]|uniref:FecR family protein n=1 Tax=Mucilaginibacter terrae TaxID=1955052 RepID=UPI00363DF7F2
MEEQKHRLIVEYFEKTITDDGLTQLQEWIEESDENLLEFSETIQILQASKFYFSQPKNSSQNWERIQTHLNKSLTNTKNTIVKPAFKWLYAAAIGLLICACGLLLQQHSSKQTPYITIKNADGKRSKIMLPDSSYVYLAGGTTIKFASDFKTDKRRVYLNGEAFFDVVHQAQRPFTVQSGNITTVVLGTSFNVKAYATNRKVAVTVSTGKVGIMANVKGKNKLVKFLMPNEQIEIDTQSGLYAFNSTDAAAVRSWTANNLIFYNTSLKDIAVALEHHYGVKIEFTDPDLQQIKLTAKFKNLPIQEVMENISLLSGIAYTQKGNQVFLTNNNQKGGKIME